MSVVNVIIKSHDGISVYNKVTFHNVQIKKLLLIIGLVPVEWLTDHIFQACDSRKKVKKKEKEGKNTQKEHVQYLQVKIETHTHTHTCIHKGLKSLKMIKIMDFI